MQNSYFPHDSNARNSDKLLPVRMKYGAEGYGIYFMLLERLRDEPTYTSIKDYNTLAFDLRVDAQKIKAVIEDFGLFSFTDDGKCFYSEGFMKRMKIKDSKSKARSNAGKKGAEKRWNEQKNSKAMAKPSSNNSEAIAMPYQNDGKESKVNKSKVNKTNKDSHNSKHDKRVYEADDINFKLAQSLLSKIEEQNPDHKKPDLQKWANDIRLMHEQDNRSYDKIQKMIDWSQNNDFWSGNVLSAAKLRKQYDTMAAQANNEAKGKTTGYRKKSGRVETATDWNKVKAKETPSNDLQERLAKIRGTEDVAN